jgi:hypothetical protein
MSDPTHSPDASDSSDPYEAVIEALRRHMRPLFGHGATFTLVVCQGDGQAIFSDDQDPEDLLLGVAKGLLELDEHDEALQARRGVSRPLH